MNRAWVCTGLSPDLSGLRMMDWPLPPCGRSDVRVRVQAAALNFPDLLMTQGKYQLKPPLPFVRHGARAKWSRVPTCTASRR
jgi:NADPH2:quinone reductase